MIASWFHFQKQVRGVGLAVGFMGFGAVGQAIYDGSAKLPWLHRQAAELRVVKTEVIPKLKAAVKCEHIRANTNEAIIDEATLGIKPLPGEAADDCAHPTK